MFPGITPSTLPGVGCGDGKIGSTPTTNEFERWEAGPGRARERGSGRLGPSVAPRGLGAA